MTESPHKRGRETHTLISLLMALALLAATGCGTTNVSKSGGVVPLDEGFSITVPKSDTITQGTEATVAILLNRGAYFKRDVRLDIKTEGITVSPNSVLVKASDKPEVQCQIRVARDAAIGDYRVTVTGTPETGKAASTVFIVKVVAQ